MDPDFNPNSRANQLEKRNKRITKLANRLKASGSTLTPSVFGESAQAGTACLREVLGDDYARVITPAGEQHWSK
jgi:hypothetical protein